MRIAITGSKGQLGTSLQQALRAEELLLIDLPECDLTNLAAAITVIGHFRPEVVIHCAAMTNVDGCESDPEAAYRVNVLGTRNVAVAAQQSSSSMVYISTDYVFDGIKSEPYWEYDDPRPLSIYGRTKWIGEELTHSLVSRYYIVRIAWLYARGFRNFVETILRLAQERGRITMVTDEVGSPTYAPDAARAIAQLIRLPAYGIYHLPNSGTCSRYEWAKEILRLAGRSDVELAPSENYQRPARVPKHAELRNFCAAELGIVMRSWQQALEDYFVERAG